MGTKIDDAITVFTGVKSGLHLKLVCVNVTLCLCYHFIGLTLTVCLVGVILGGMENIEWKIEWKTVFFNLWEREENPGENFLSRAHKFRLPKSGGKV